MKWVFFALTAAHGLIHLMGFAKAFGLAEMPQLTQPISRSLGVVWLGAAVALLVTAALVVTAPRTWWMVGLAAVAVSQTAIITSWSDAKYGTIANLVILAAVAYGFASEGPLGLRAEYRSEVAARLEGRATPATLTESDVAGLPPPVRRYLHLAGAVGQPRPTYFGVRFRGRIRGGPDEPWMEFTAEQHSFLEEPARFFLMSARRGGLPVDVLHAFRGGSASMRVRLLSAVSLANAAGPDATRAETVTLLNDQCVLVPGALVDAAVRWEEVDERTARAHYTLESNTVSATLRFDEAGQLVDFVSDDRLAASPNGSQFMRQRWSTPLREYRAYGPIRAASRGEGRWYTADGTYAYIELEVVDLVVNGAFV